MYHDLRSHICALDERGLLVTVERAFLFTNVTDVRGRSYENAVLVGGLAATPQVYAVGLGTDLSAVAARWDQALTHPVEPILVEDGPVHEVVQRPGGGSLDFDSMPIPISTPGFENAPYLTSAHVISRSSSGDRNVGHYRAQIKSPRTCGVFFTGTAKHGYRHWTEARARGEPLELAFVIGSPPAVSYAAVAQVPYGSDEYGVAGGLAQEPVRLVKCATVDLEVPADAELVVEGHLRTDQVEPEGPFGESHGYVHPRSMSPLFEISAVTHRRGYIWTSFISQVTPSESSVIKKVSLEPMLTGFLRDTLGVKSVQKIVMHEPLTNLRKVVFVQFDRPAHTEVWRALKGVAAYRSEIGKIVIAVDRDINPRNLDAVWWAIAYRCRPHRDVQTVRGQDKGHAPPFNSAAPVEDFNLLIDATLKDPTPPISLPSRRFMEGARKIWAELGLPELRPEDPWHGYVLTPEEWPDELIEEADLAVRGRHYETGRKLGSRAEPATLEET